jgi:tRNA-Thr(GGU) m(6)t(6)A37 methyltransferase TsaA
MDIAKALAGALGVNRALFGLSYLLRPQQARTSWIGRVARKPAAQVIIRSQGVRDVALGAGALCAVARGDARELRRWALAHAACDATDLVATFLAREHLPERSARLALVVAGASTLVGAGAAARLRPASTRPESAAPDPDTALVAVGRVESPLRHRAAAPNQGDEGAPDAWLVFDERLEPALEGIASGDDVLVFTWLDRADRNVLRVHPRGDPARPEQGVFNTRSPDRPNPIGLHRVTVAAIEGRRLLVGPMEALDGTPIVDVKPLLGTMEER